MHYTVDDEDEDIMFVLLWLIERERQTEWIGGHAMKRGGVKGGGV